jgi:hypothetical protein
MTSETRQFVRASAKRKTMLMMVLALGAITLPGCTQSTESQLATCRMDALKTFFQFREKNEFGIRWPPTTGELDYVELCMKTRGFELDYDKVKMAHPDPKYMTEPVYRDMVYSNKAYWK